MFYKKRTIFKRCWANYTFFHKWVQFGSDRANQMAVFDENCSSSLLSSLLKMAKSKTYSDTAKRNGSVFRRKEYRFGKMIRDRLLVLILAYNSVKTASLYVPSLRRYRPLKQGKYWFFMKKLAFLRENEYRYSKMFEIKVLVLVTSNT